MARVRDPLDPKISLWHFLAFALRFEREKHGLSLAQCGEIINAARSTVCNIEAGRLKLGEDQARRLDKRYNTARMFELLIWFAKSTHDPTWVQQCIDIEVRAEILRIYQGQVIPVPLQTEAYARAFLTIAGVEDVEAALAMRKARQEAVLGRKEPPALIVLLDEDAVDRPVGGNGVIKDQLQHLLELGERPHVIIRVVPRSVGAHTGLNGPFQVMSLEADVAYIGAFHGGRTVQDPIEVRELAVDFELIGAKALSEDASRILLREIMEGFS